jgi:hypothetical protein
MSFNLLFQQAPAPYAAIARFLPAFDQVMLARSSRMGRKLVDTANLADFNRLKCSNVYKDCEEQIKRFTVGAEQQASIRAAIPILDVDLIASSKALGLAGATQVIHEREDGPLTIVERVKIAEQIDLRKAENLHAFFNAISLVIPEASTFKKTLVACETVKEKAREIRDWMQENRQILSSIKSLSAIGEISQYFIKRRSSMPSEVLFFEKISQDDFYSICECSLRDNCPWITRKIVEDSRLLQLPPVKLGELLDYAIMGGVHHFVEFVLGSKEFDAVPADLMIKAFERALRRSDSKVWQMFAVHRRFSEIPAENIGQALMSVVNEKNTDLVAVLIRDVRFNLITTSKLCSIICQAIRKGQVDIAMTLFETKRALSLKYEKLKEIFETAHSQGNLSEFKLFFKKLGKTRNRSTQSLSSSPESSDSEGKSAPVLELANRAKKAISAIRAENGECSSSDDSSSDSEMSAKENTPPISPLGKRVREEITETSEQQRNVKEPETREAKRQNSGPCLNAFSVGNL